jgi:Fic family protein
MISDRQNSILTILKVHGDASFAQIFRTFGDKVSDRTIKRDLSELVSGGYLSTSGGGRSVTYSLSLRGRLFSPFDATAYVEEEPDRRIGALRTYRFELWNEWPQNLFDSTMYAKLTSLSEQYRRAVMNRPSDIQAREWERFVIELSWKSSRIEGNTYTLLDTERLIKEGVPSEKNTPEETRMILNHKTAFDFVRNHPLTQIGITPAFIDEVHALLMDGLIHDVGFRTHGVGITGSVYHPLDTVYQIQEELDQLIQCINTRETVFDKALTALTGLSYIQPFVDGNKRSARLVTNALLMKGGAAPLSYRNVNEVFYRASLLAFYEQLSIVPMRTIFLDQYQFAVEHYA